MLTTFEYDSSYYPAVPVMEVGLSTSGVDTPARHILALIDTGADATMMPLELLLAAGARYVGRRSMRGIIGMALEVNIFVMTVHIAGHAIHGIRAVGLSSGGEAIIGRDVLNQLVVTLNGLAHVVEVSA